MSFTIEFFAPFMRIGLTVFEVNVIKPLTENQVQFMIHILRVKLLGPANCNPNDFEINSVHDILQTLFGSSAIVYPTKTRYSDIVHFIGIDTQELLIRVNEEAIPLDSVSDLFIETGLQKIDTSVHAKKSSEMSHLHFCQNESCDASKTKKCAGCYSTWYCSTECQQVDWPNHKTECKEIQQDRLAVKLYTQIAESMGRDVANYPYEEFKKFLKNQPTNDRMTLGDWMEDWLEGWYTYDRERKQLLRSVFLAKGLIWSSDVYPFYTEWAKNRSGNRYEKIMGFVKETGFLF
jgi:hypothetical protein